MGVFFPENGSFFALVFQAVVACLFCMVEVAHGGSLQSVQIEWGVVLTCFTHALTCENEESMGLILGDWILNDM